ncbi:MAG TPA: hypothetical protein VE338_08750 [Ktedonobacterales bacterium]|jgi:hypothetical protein|nr:hypothetical protein [Ktedonobacterales bacterium]
MGRSSGLESSQSSHEITDLFDTQRGTFLVRYPLWLVLGLGISGVIAFAMVGFLGYPGDPKVFTKPWELYLWFSALMITLLVSIFRHRSLRGQLIATLIIALLCIIIVYVIGFPGGFIRDLLKKYLPLLADEQLTYVVVNFAIILIFWVDTIRRWIRRAAGLRLHPEVDLTTGEKIDEKVDPADQPSMAELISGDLLAGSALTGLLSYLFMPAVMNHIVITHPALGDCNLAVSFPPSACLTHGVSYTTLTFLDQTQALAYITIGLVVLGLAAMLGGFGSVGGAPVPVGVAQVVNAVNAEGAPVTAPITTGVAETVLDALRAAINRRLRALLVGLGRSLRNIVWPILLFVATYGIFWLSVNIQSYLHAQHKDINAVLSFILPAAIWGLVSVFSLVFSAALTLFRWRVADNTLRFLGLIGFIVLLTFWIFSLALWGFNVLLEQFNANVVRPFDPPSWATAASAIALVIFGGYVLLRGGARSGGGRPSAASRPVVAARVSATGAATPSASSDGPANQSTSAQE